MLTEKIIRIKEKIKDKIMLKNYIIFSDKNKTNDEKNVRDTIEEEFLIFKSIAYNSRVYVQVVTKERLFLFEVYKVTQNSTLTISMLCQMNLEPLKVEFLNDRNIWQRRKNLTGVNLKIGIMLDHPLTIKGEKVFYIVFNFNKNKVAPCLFSERPFSERLVSEYTFSEV